MKKTHTSEFHDNGTGDVGLDDMLPEYDFDYRKARPNRFTVKSGKTPITVTLDSDIAEVFTTSEAVNAALRTFLSAITKDFEIKRRKRIRLAGSKTR